MEASSPQDVMDNSERFARVLSILLEAPSRWAPAMETALPASLTQLRCVLSDEEEEGADLNDPRRGVMWVGGGDCFDGEAVYKALQKLQRRAEEFRFLGTLACVCKSARTTVAAVAKVSPAEMEVQVAQAAAMVPLCAQAMTAEVLQEVSIDQVRCSAACERISGTEARRRSLCARAQAIDLWRELCQPGGKPPTLEDDEPDVSALGPKAVAERWREILRRGSTPEMRESKTEHLLAGIARDAARTGKEPTPWPGGASHPRRFRASPFQEHVRVSMENGKPWVHPLELLLWPWRKHSEEDNDF
jgi:hypothetical protein